MKLISKLLVVACCMTWSYGYAQQGSDTANTQYIKPVKNKKSMTCDGSCCCAGNVFTPLGVMTDHIHAKGTWMASYSYMNMAMQGSRMGTKSANENTVYESYMMAPDKMTMQMHMAMLMYGVTDRLTLMAMGGFSSYNMSMDMSSAAMSMPGMVMTPGNMTMKSTSSGLADTKVSALYNFSQQAKQRIIGSLGVSVPTGTINATGITVLGANQRLPYNMQTGTGSYSILPGITYVRNYTAFSYGAEAGADIKLNNNSLGYRCGNNYHATAWAGYKFLPFVSASLRAEYLDADKISGSDAAMDISYYQDADPSTKASNYGGDQVNVYVGLNFHFMTPVLQHFTMLAEYGMPVYQNVNGTQMAVHNNLLAGVNYSF